MYSKRTTESRNFWAGRKYCSKRCANKATMTPERWAKMHAAIKPESHRHPKPKGAENPQWKRVTKCCEECGEFFTVQNYRKDMARFCSHECEHRHRDQGRTAQNERQRKSAAYRAWRTLVFERDDYTCQACGRRGGDLHADHVRPFAYNPELRLEITNGRTLCVKCHQKTPTYGIGAVRLANCVATSQET